MDIEPAPSPRPEWAGMYRILWVALAAAVVAGTAVPLINAYTGGSIKDYANWYTHGRQYLHGQIIYPRQENFPFMYPPSFAAMLAMLTAGGRMPMIFLMAAGNSAAWLGSILLSVYLATGKALRRDPAIYLLPSLVVIVYIWEMYLLGQPNLVLLLCMLGAFACLRLGRPWSAGGLIAVAAAIKAFPVMAAGYLIYRRMWKAMIALVMVLAFLLLAVPSLIRGPRLAWRDMTTWTNGMVLHYNARGIAQRPGRGYSYKNQSLMAVANRLLRHVEAKTGRYVNVVNLDFRVVNGVIVGVGLGLCLFYMAVMPGGLWWGWWYVREKWRKGEKRGAGPQSQSETHASAPGEGGLGRRLGVSVGDRKSGWRAVRDDAIEQAMLLLMMLIFSPLSFTYFLVWLLYPLTLVLAMAWGRWGRWHGRRRRPDGTETVGWRVGMLGLFAAVPIILLASIPFLPQAWGSGLWVTLLLLFGLGWELWHNSYRHRPTDTMI